MREYVRAKAGAQTVKGSILQLLGVLTEQFCGELIEKEESLQKIYMDTLKQQSSKAEPETQLVASTFLGLCAYMTNFGKTLEDGADYLKTLYMYITKALELTDAARYDIPKGKSTNQTIKVFFFE